MMRYMAAGADLIFLACGVMDFRKQTAGLTAMVSLQSKLDLYKESHVFIFCNKEKDAIKVLRYDKNGFVLATKKLLDDMRCHWTKTPSEVREIPPNLPAGRVTPGRTGDRAEKDHGQALYPHTRAAREPGRDAKQLSSRTPRRSSIDTCRGRKRLRESVG